MDWLKCNICLNSYNESNLRPRTLTCGHTFCETCLNKTIKNETLTCPQCRKIHKEIHSALDLPVNFTLEGLLNSLSFSDTKGPSITGAGMCKEHPDKALIYRCTVHNTWICEQCVTYHGDHPMEITTFQEEIEHRRKKQKRFLDEEEISYNETFSAIEKHIHHLNDERECHIGVLKMLQNLVILHENEEKYLQKEINTFKEIIRDGKDVKKRLLDVEGAVLNAVTLVDSNTAWETVKSKKTEAKLWKKMCRGLIEEGKLKVERSTHLAMSTKRALDYTGENGKKINKPGQIEKSTNYISVRDIEVVRHNLNKIFCQYEDKLKYTNVSNVVTDVQIFLLNVLIFIGAKEDKNTSWAVERVEGCKDFEFLVGEITIRNDMLLLHSMQPDRLPQVGIKLDFGQVKASVLSPPVVFLTLSHNGTTLGTIQIVLNEQNFPRRVKQFLALSTGMDSWGGYLGAGFDRGLFNGRGKVENVSCGGYINVDGDLCSNALHDLEMGPCRTIPVIAGDVYGRHNPNISGGFSICTRSWTRKTISEPVIGRITSGLPVLQEAADKGHNYVRQIVFSECGVQFGTL